MATKKSGDSTTRRARPRLHASHSEGASAKPGVGAGAKKAASGDGSAKGKTASGSTRAAARPSRRTATTAKPQSVRRTASAGQERRAVPAPQRSPSSARRPSLPPLEPSAETRARAVAIAAAGLDKKAIGVEILNVCGKVDYADFLVIMTGSSDRHISAIAAGIEDELRKMKVRPLSLEGLSQATWVLIDFGDVVVHVFQEDARRMYDIEGLWIDADRVQVPETESAS